MSYCVTSTCPHNRGAFIWLADGEPYVWVHDTSAPEARGHLEVCDLMTPVTAAEAGEACADCGHGTGEDGHRWPQGSYTGEFPSPLRCTCGCERWVQPAPPPGATVGNAGEDDWEQRRRLSAGEAAPGGPGACTRDGCGHLTLWHGTGGRYKGQPCQKCQCAGWTDQPDAVMPVQKPRAGVAVRVRRCSMTRPVLYDLFSGAGGAGEGYHRAGFRVIGIDLRPMPNYPHEFVQADAMQVLQFLADDAEPWPGAPFPDAIHASPPCQRKSRMTNCRPGLAAAYPDLVGPVRDLLTEWDGAPWIIENVAGAGLPGQDDLYGAYGVMLCGAMFGRSLYRHRWFQASFPLSAPNHPRHLVPASRAGHWKPGTIISVEGNFSPVALAREVMDIDWCNREELAESIPPYFTEHLGRQLAGHLTAERAA